MLDENMQTDLVYIHDLLPAALIMKDEEFIKDNFKNFSRLLNVHDGKQNFKIILFNLKLI